MYNLQFHVSIYFQEEYFKGSGRVYVTASQGRFRDIRLRKVDQLQDEKRLMCTFINFRFWLQL
jgi:hypothetical protein